LADRDWRSFGIDCRRSDEIARVRKKQSFRLNVDWQAASFRRREQKKRLKRGYYIPSPPESDLIQEKTASFASGTATSGSNRIRGFWPPKLLVPDESPELG
jgi:hypothetical protein